MSLRVPPAADLATALADTLNSRQPRTLGIPGRRAAVLVCVYDHRGEPHLLLTRRTDTLRNHSGQISFPGGARDDDDADLHATALREAHEEVGIPPAQVRVLGDLDDVPTAVSDFIVTPVVGYLERRPDPVPNPHEIARVLEVPVAEVLRIDAELPPHAGVATLRYPLDGEDVWGATARMLRLFARVARGALGA